MIHSPEKPSKHGDSEATKETSLNTLLEVLLGLFLTTILNKQTLLQKTFMHTRKKDYSMIFKGYKHARPHHTNSIQSSSLVVCRKRQHTTKLSKHLSESTCLFEI